MAKREEAVNMTEQFAEFKELKDIDKTTLIAVLEESFRSVLSKMFGNDDNFDVIVNPDKGDCEIYQNLLVVEDGEVENPNKEISLSEARADEDPDCEVGEDHTRKIDFTKFGRRAILNLRQTLASKILELQKDANREGGQHQQQSQNHRLSHQPEFPEAPVRAGGARDPRRSDRHPRRCPHPG